MFYSTRPCRVQTPIPSVYGKDCIEILHSVVYPGYIWQREKVRFSVHEPDVLCTLDVAYSSYNGDYMGSLEDAQYLCYTLGLRGLRNQDGASIGFSSSENKWYGWSHRAICSFTIGSTCKKGDCAYAPTTKEEFVEDLVEFFGLNWTWRTCEHPDIKVLGFATDIKHNVPTTDGLGVSFLGRHVFIGAPSRNFIAYYTYPYKLGRGEWTAKTLHEAKQMAIDFSRSVS